MIGIYSQHPRNKIGCFFGEIELVFRVVCIVYFPIKLLIGGTLEREVASQSDKGQHSQRPDIGCFSPVLPFLYYFGRHVARSSTK